MPICSVSSTTVIVPFLLKENNYEDWRIYMKNYLLAQDLWGIIESGDDADFYSSSNDVGNWGRKNAVALNAIHTTSSADIFAQIKEIKLAKNAWSKLAKMHQEWQSKLKPKTGMERSDGGKEDEITKRPHSGGSDKSKIDLKRFLTKSTMLHSEGLDEGEEDEIIEMQGWDGGEKDETIKMQGWDGGKIDLKRFSTELLAREEDETTKMQGWDGGEEDAITEKTHSDWSYECEEDEITEMIHFERWDQGKETTKMQGSNGGKKEEMIEDSRFVELKKSICKGDWNAVKQFFVYNKHPLDTIILSDEGHTALHVAIQAGQDQIAEELVAMMSETDLEIKTKNLRHTFLTLVASTGRTHVAKCIVKRKNKLLTVRCKEGHIPVTVACSMGHKEMTYYLYSVTPPVAFRPENGNHGFDLMRWGIDNKMLGLKVKLPVTSFGEVRILVTHDQDLTEKNTGIQGSKFQA
ncbi:hypothetical protein SLEP1_g43554 [Rubroshorea leprosula]|uniref:DUF4219 domain-containing protein n=1 Tax=Rubroshorea leprosula TaxID=152421 RepID=A0AAV5LDB9_9ROSI|nr:hypothetical protein SLEP1_g43554 [Rubroshorea leprosula]